ncbi:hypothetical protein GGR58DRAFT_486321 [Xylaria digitata]|nr:hypothetical protein GGR58DRAFT_486321 [Xylaria digitata]
MAQHGLWVVGGGVASTFARMCQCSHAFNTSWVVPSIVYSVGRYRRNASSLRGMEFTSTLQECTQNTLLELDFFHLFAYFSYLSKSMRPYCR